MLLCINNEGRGKARQEKKIQGINKKLDFLKEI